MSRLTSFLVAGGILGVSVALPNQSTVAELVTALNKVKASSRDIITILQTVKRAGALHAELVIQ